MDFLRLTSCDAPEFKAAIALYQISFPLHEQRLPAHQALAMQNSAYHFDCLMENGVFIGILLYWEATDFLYVEHFAILLENRGGGYGTKGLALLCKSVKPVILEIDPPIDDISINRQHFYEHAGFAKNEFAHIHPPYRRGNHGHELVVMSSPYAIPQALYKTFAKYLRNPIMTYAER